MNAAATDIIVARSREADRLATMVMWSVAAHVLVAAFVLLAPSASVGPASQPVVMIRLDGAPGPRTGMTQMAARPVQAAQSDQRRAEAPPAARRPAMSLPDAKSKPRPADRNAPRDAAATTPATGPEVQEGTATSSPRIRGRGFSGLSGGGGAGGGAVTVDATDFCCTDYVDTLVTLVTQSWNGRQGIAGVTRMVFTIERSGVIEGIRVEVPSGFDRLDAEARRALQAARLPALPGRYTNPSLTVHLDFVYERR